MERHASFRASIRGWDSGMIQEECRVALQEWFERQGKWDVKSVRLTKSVRVRLHEGRGVPEDGDVHARLHGVVGHQRGDGYGAGLLVTPFIFPCGPAFMGHQAPKTSREWNLKRQRPLLGKTRDGILL